VVATTQEGYLIPTYGPTGISPSAGAEAGMAAGRAVQTQREQTLTSRQSRDSVDQQMKIRTEEQRRIEEDRVIAAAQRAQQQRAAAAAAARAAQQRAAIDAYMANLPVPGATTPGVAVPGAATPYVPNVSAPPVGLSVPTPGLPVPPTGIPLSFGEPDSQFDIQDIQLLSGELPVADPRGTMQMPGVPGVTAPVGVRVPAPQRSFMTPESMDTRAAIGAMPAGLSPSTEGTGGRRGPIQDMLDYFTRRRVQNETARAEAGLPPAPEVDALRAQIDAQRVATGGRPLPPEVPAPAATTPAATTPAATTPAATTPAATTPVVDTSWGGTQLDFGTPVQLTFGEAEGRGSEIFVDAPEKIFEQNNKVQQDRAQMVQLAELYRALGDVSNYTTTVNQIGQLDFDNQYLDGMLAIVGIQQGNFGPLQELMTARYPGQQVEVRPYTDETVEVFVGGRSEGREDWADLAEKLRRSYDTNYINGLNALAAEAASRDKFEFESAVKLEEEVAKAQLDIVKKAAEISTQEQFDQLYREGKLEMVDSERGLYNYVVDGTSVLVEALVTNGIISVRPADTSAVPRLVR
jgi:hypothetical protein